MLNVCYTKAGDTTKQPQFFSVDEFKGRIYAHTVYVYVCVHINAYVYDLKTFLYFTVNICDFYG